MGQQGRDEGRDRHWDPSEDAAHPDGVPSPEFYRTSLLDHRIEQEPKTPPDIGKDYPRSALAGVAYIESDFGHKGSSLPRAIARADAD
jgi:hypothetical protein